MFIECTNVDRMYVSTQHFWASITPHGSAVIVLIFSKEMVRIQIFRKSEFENLTKIKIQMIIKHFIFFAADTATMIEVDHEAQDYTEFQMHSAEFNANAAEATNGQRGLNDLNGIAPTIESVTARLHAPVTSNRIDMDKISFERNKTGIWGWRNDKTESINGYECKVFAASNVEFVTRTRSDHLNENQARVNCSRTDCVSAKFNWKKFVFSYAIFIPLEISL